MNNLKKHILLFSLFTAVALGVYIPTTHNLHAVDNTTVKLLVGDLPGLPGETNKIDGTKTMTIDLIRYTQLIYKLSIGLAGVIGFVMITVGGFQYLVSEDKGAAKERITNAIWGFVLLISTYVILNTINPDLLTFKDLSSYGTISTNTTGVGTTKLNPYHITVKNLDNNKTITTDYSNRASCSSALKIFKEATTPWYSVGVCYAGGGSEGWCYTYKQQVSGAITQYECGFLFEWSCNRDRDEFQWTMPKSQSYEVQNSNC